MRISSRNVAAIVACLVACQQAPRCEAYSASTRNAVSNARSSALHFRAPSTSQPSWVVPQSRPSAVAFERSVLFSSEAASADMSRRGTAKAVELSKAVAAIKMPAQTNSMGKKRFAAVMAFLTGWGQVATFLKYQTFSTMMTGNTMWMARALVESRPMDAVYYLTVIIAYLAGIVSFRQSNSKLEKKSLALVCAPLVASLFVGSDILMNMLQNRWLPVTMLSAGFGLVNSVGQQVAGTLTFVITGHYTRLAQQAMDSFSMKAGKPKFRTEGTYLGLAILASFFVGAFTACASFQSTTGGNILPAWVWNKTFSILGLSYSALFLYHDREIIRTGILFRSVAECRVDDDGTSCD